MEMLKDARVAVSRTGGVGGYMAEGACAAAWARSTFIDDDKVCLTNINRQIYATRKTVGYRTRWMLRLSALKTSTRTPWVRTYNIHTPETADQFDFKTLRLHCGRH